MFYSLAMRVGIEVLLQCCSLLNVMFCFRFQCIQKFQKDYCMSSIWTVAEINIVDAHLYEEFHLCADVVTAYKELQTEKIALEESLKALSLSRSRSDDCELNSSAASQADKEGDLASEQQAADFSISSELSDSLVLMLNTFFYRCCYWVS